MRNLIFVAPFPMETTLRFARGLAQLPHRRLLGVFQQAPVGAARRLFDDVVEVPEALTTGHLVRGIELLKRRYGAPHRILGILEPLQVQLAEARAHFGVPGTSVRTADLFRDKAKMKDALREAGLPVARHRLLSAPEEGLAFAEQVGFPLVLKPPAGMGAKATFRVRDVGSLRGALGALMPSRERPVLAEEFLTGKEYSFDTLTLGGEVRFRSISRYLPTPLEVLENPWIQWVCLLPRQISEAHHLRATKVGMEAVRALGLEDGFTHMEWFLRPDGSVAIGEIAQRPPGAHITRMIGLAHDIDPYLAWARAVVDGAFDGPWERKHSVGCAFFRGMGKGRVARLSGVDEAQQKVGRFIIEAKLPVIGAPKSDSYEGDGYAIVRAARTETVEQVLKELVATVRVHYA